jgi:hypothetical protein
VSLFVRTRLVGIAIAGVAALGATGLITGAAQAYPPGVKLTVMATNIQPVDKTGEFNVTLQLGNAPPSCSLSIKVGGQAVGTFVTDASGAAGAVTVKIKPTGDHSATIQVKSACKPRERASTQVRLARAHLEGPAECKIGKSCVIEAEHYPYPCTVVFTATKWSAPTLTRSTSTNKGGKAFADFSFPQEGAWAIVGACQSESHTWWVQVKKPDSKSDHDKKPEKKSGSSH